MLGYVGKLVQAASFCGLIVQNAAVSRPLLCCKTGLFRMVQLTIVQF